MTRSCLNICSCNTTWLLPSSCFSRRELRDTVLVAEHQWRLLLLNTQFISELQNDLYRRITAGWQSDMHGRYEEETDRSLSSHTDSSSSPNYFKTEEKWIWASYGYSHYYMGEWYIFPVFAKVTVPIISVLANLLSCNIKLVPDYLSAAAFDSHRDFNWVVARSLISLSLWVLKSLTASHSLLSPI